MSTFLNKDNMNTFILYGKLRSMGEMPTAQEVLNKSIILRDTSTE